MTNTSEESNEGIEVEIDLTKVDGRPHSVEATLSGDGWRVKSQGAGGPKEVNRALDSVIEEMYRTLLIVEDEPIPAIRRVD